MGISLRRKKELSFFQLRVERKGGAAPPLPQGEKRGEKHSQGGGKKRGGKKTLSMTKGKGKKEVFLIFALRGGEGIFPKEEQKERRRPRLYVRGEGGDKAPVRGDGRGGRGREEQRCTLSCWEQEKKERGQQSYGTNWREREGKSRVVDPECPGAEKPLPSSNSRQVEREKEKETGCFEQNSRGGQGAREWLTDQEKVGKGKKGAAWFAGREKGVRVTRMPLARGGEKGEGGEKRREENEKVAAGPHLRRREKEKEKIISSPPLAPENGEKEGKRGKKKASVSRRLLSRWVPSVAKKKKKRRPAQPKKFNLEGGGKGEKPTSGPGIVDELKKKIKRDRKEGGQPACLSPVGEKKKGRERKKGKKAGKRGGPCRRSSRLIETWKRKKIKTNKKGEGGKGECAWKAWVSFFFSQKRKNDPEPDSSTIMYNPKRGATPGS